MVRHATPLRVLLLALVVAAGAGLPALAAPGAAGATAATGYAPDREECRLLGLINGARGKRGALRLSAALGAAAEHHSREMARRGRLYHSDLRRNARGHGYGGASLAENVGYGAAAASAMLRAWQGSPGHRRNLLDGDYTAVGIARAQGDGAWYWTTVFGDAADRTVGC